MQVLTESKKIIGSLYIDKIGLGIGKFDAQKCKFAITKIKYYTFLDYIKIKSIFEKCTVLITNSQKSPIISEIPGPTLIVMSEKGLEDGVIDNNLNSLPTLNLNSLSNSKTLIQAIKMEKYKYKALGMLLFHLISQNFGKENTGNIYLQDVYLYADELLFTMNITNKQFQYLQIMREQIHPSLVKGKGKSKEGFSLLNVYESYVQSRGGKRILHNIFSNPNYNSEKLKSSYQLITWVRKYMISTNYPKIFKGLCSAENLLLKFQQINVEEDDWKKIVKLLQSCIDLKESFVLNLGYPNVIAQFVNYAYWDSLKQLLMTIKSTIDLTPFQIKNNVDKELDNMKHIFHNMPNVMNLYAYQHDWNFPFQLIFMPQIGYLIKISKQLDLSVIPQDWILQFQNAYSQFYSNILTEKLDNDYGDIEGDIKDRQKKILFDLQAYVLDNAKYINEIYWKACYIECYWGISKISKDMSIPNLSSESLIIFNGWHPLLGHIAIDNHYFSFNHSDKTTPLHRVYNLQQNLVNTNYTNRCMLLSGPNGSGKTIYMKQLAIIVYMAHIGLLIPAQLAQIPLCDGICSLGHYSSYYSSECGLAKQLHQLSLITTKGTITNKTLVLIDELGSSIDYKSSLKLLYATVRHLSDIHPQNPLIKTQNQLKNPLFIIITHLTQMLTSWLLAENKSVRYLTMEISGQRKFLYKIKPGLVAKGYGLDTARSILSEQFCNRSYKFWVQITNRNCIQQ